MHFEIITPIDTGLNEVTNVLVVGDVTWDEPSHTEGKRNEPRTPHVFIESITDNDGNGLEHLYGVENAARNALEREFLHKVQS